MAQPAFYNNNAHRAFPFLKGTVDLPPAGPTTLRNLANAVVVDAGFVAGVLSRFEPADHAIYLARINRTGNVFTLRFESDAPELFDVALEFTRHAGGADNQVEFTDSGQTGLSASSQSFADDGCQDPLWSGYLVTGSAAELELLLPGDGTIERGAGACVVEPGLVQNLAGSYVTKLGLANDDRVRSTGAADCADPVFPYPTDVIHVATNCLLGDVRFKAGFNATVRQSGVDNSITLGAAVGAGEGQPCGELPLFAGEGPPEGSNLLAGGPQCNEVLRSVNGLPGPNLTFVSGRGVTVTAVPDENKVRIGVDMTGLAVCYDVERVSESC